MKRLMILLVCLVLAPSLAMDCEVSAKPKKKTEQVSGKSKKSKKGGTVAVDTVAKKKVSKYDRTFVKDRNCVTARAEGGFIALHKVKGKLYIEMPLATMGREMLIASTISSTSAADLASIGYKPTTPMHVKFELADSTVYMSEVSVLPDYDEDNAPMSRAVSRNSMSPVLDAYKVMCWNNDSSAVVFEVTKMYTGNYEKLAPVKSGNAGGV